MLRVFSVFLKQKMAVLLCSLGTVLGGAFIGYGGIILLMLFFPLIIILCGIWPLFCFCSFLCEMSRLGLLQGNMVEQLFWFQSVFSFSVSLRLACFLRFPGFILFPQHELLFLSYICGTILILFLMVSLDGALAGQFQEFMTVTAPAYLNLSAVLALGLLLELSKPYSGRCCSQIGPPNFPVNTSWLLGIFLFLDQTPPCLPLLTLHGTVYTMQISCFFLHLFVFWVLWGTRHLVLFCVFVVHGILVLL